jgi:hypothetical protein
VVPRWGAPFAQAVGGGVEPRGRGGNRMSIFLASPRRLMKSSSRPGTGRIMESVPIGICALLAVAPPMSATVPRESEEGVGEVTFEVRWTRLVRMQTPEMEWILPHHRIFEPATRSSRRLGPIGDTEPPPAAPGFGVSMGACCSGSAFRLARGRARTAPRSRKQSPCGLRMREARGWSVTSRTAVAARLA